MKNLLPFLLLPCLFFACQPKSTPPPIIAEEKPVPPVTSLTGKQLLPPAESPESKARKDSLLAIAQKNYESDSANLDNIIWLGRRVAYLWRYQEAIDIFTHGLKKFPASPELYRHRGHRYLSIRQFDKAISDFERAEALAFGRSLQIEPDGLPNKLNQPLSNLQFNIYYHWALALYLKGEFEKAAEIYGRCMRVSDNPDLEVATADWLYMTFRRLGKNVDAEALLAKIPDDLQLIENDSYYNRIKMYKGILKPEELLDFSKTDLGSQLDLVTQGYGVGNWYLYNGNNEKAHEIFNQILQTNYWSAFGYIAAEAEIARIAK